MKGGIVHGRGTMYIYIYVYMHIYVDDIPPPSDPPFGVLDRPDMAAHVRLLTENKKVPHKYKSSSVSR